MWNETEIEKLFKHKINKEAGRLQNVNKYIAYYDTVKEYLCDNLYKNINIKEPDLTDHGEDHIKNVLQNSYKLISEDNFTGVELYTLCMAILIHDIGNLNGRTGHEKMLKKYFNSTIFPTISKNHITIISLIASKHGGRECDSIGSLTEDNIDGEKIRSAKIASLLRFSDEISEGKQRTSNIFFEENNLIQSKRLIYHQYASILEQPIIENNYINLDFNIYLKSIQNIGELIKEIFRRINKLNNERIYCSHYNEDIYKIKKVVVGLNFFKNDETFTSITTTEDNLLNFELSGKNIHCDAKNDKKQERQIEKILNLIREISATEEN